LAERWATFDCYGTLIDWNAGILAVLERLFGVEEAPALLRRYHELEPEVQGEGYRAYAEVMTLVVERLAQESGHTPPEGESSALARSLPDWPPFDEVPEALAELRHRGWWLAILSNSDRDLISASMKRLAVPFDLAIVAEDVRSYKPAHAHWERFFEVTTAEREHHVHVAQSHFHDITPAHDLGIPSVWINRRGERHDPAPTREMSDLRGLADTLDELVSA
jgi:2-haloacid dehalogenase